MTFETSPPAAPQQWATPQYAAPAYAAPDHAAQQSPRPRRSALALWACIAAAAVLAARLVFAVVQPIVTVAALADYSSTSAIYAVMSVVSNGTAFVISIVAIVLGCISLARREPWRVRAAMAVGVGVAGVVGVVSTVVFAILQPILLASGLG